MGKIHVTIYEARNMAYKDMIGKSDPYVIISFAGQKCQTRVLRNNHAPVWNESFSFPIASMNDLYQPLQLDVFDKDRFTRDDRLGSATVHVDRIAPGQPNDMWVPLSGTQRGDVHIQVFIEGLGQPGYPQSTPQYGMGMPTTAPAPPPMGYPPHMGGYPGPAPGSAPYYQYADHYGMPPRPPMPMSKKEHKTWKKALKKTGFY
eukprot:gb/GECH01011870.1/.p1 GENE.gb/GECH01011870.1/~~gb/GECH01011870.1/.p1  ORF type:complete len:203 (+),score=40.70 gb/GECH01011870.1/:1-609(+)